MARESTGSSSARAAEELKPPKRRRIAVACNACRIRKSRCNGAYPKCSNCEGLGFECNYETSENTSNVVVRKEQMAVLDTRLHEVEKQLALHSEFLRSHWNNCNNNASGSSTDLLPPPALLTNTISSMTAHVAETEVAEDDYERTATDGMAMSFVDENDFAFYGPTSNIHFMRSIISAVSPTERPGDSDTPSAMKSTVESIMRASRAHSDDTRPQTSTIDPYALPSEPEMRRILASYFCNTNYVFPFTHQDTFMQEFDAAQRTGFKKVRLTWLGLLNMMFAMAGNADNTGNPASVDPQVFYDRAVKLCHREMFRGTTIETVKILLLASLYLQGVQKSVQTFTIHGLAVKACFSLGLHSTQSSHRFSHIDNEIRKRTFYTCVILDRTLSFSFGRPPMIAHDYVRLPLPEDWPGQGADPEGKRLTTLFFRASITLFNISYLVIQHMHGLNIETVTDEDTLVSYVLTTGRDLDKWKASLPADMSLVSTEDLSSNTFQLRWRCILTLRYLNVRLMLHRPFLSMMLQDIRTNPRNTALTVQPMIGHVKKPCMDAAKETVDLLYTALDTDGLIIRITGAWWFTLHYVFSAYLVLAADVVVTLNSIVDDASEEVQSLRSYLSKAVKCLNGISGDPVIISRCRQYMEKLSNSLSEYGMLRLRSWLFRADNV
ncbi:Fungal specific transcription factor domain-containing protein 21 [Elsinoe fawcettii]|nr:Fungal specific transcription factor domain-containing protein 21 [Elsinoe fawcettii]